MTQSPQHAPPAAANANVRSAGWNGAGIPQTAPGWCFAAAEQLVQRAFGVMVSQVEVAHNILLARGRAQDPHGQAEDYYEGLRAIGNEHDLPNLEWPTVRQYVASNRELFRWLSDEYGNPPLSGRRHTRGNAPDAATIVQTIDGGGLVIIGTVVHWKVVYGYTSDASGQVTSYGVYDPGRGHDDPTMTPARTVAGIEETYYVTG
jgi:hypothetical protein